MSTIIRINNFIQLTLKEKGLTEMSAVELGALLNEAGILKDIAVRPGLPLRNYLRKNKIAGAYQYPNNRWVVRRIDFEKLLSTKEAAEKLGITEQALYKRIDRKQIQVKRIDRIMVIPESALTQDNKNPLILEDLGNQLFELKNVVNDLSLKIDHLVDLVNKVSYEFSTTDENKAINNNKEVKMVTLHEEIRSILIEAGKPLTTKEIAEKVNQRKNYFKKDRSLVSDFQIHGRTKNYPNLFERNGTLVSLRDDSGSLPGSIEEGI